MTEIMRSVSKLLGFIDENRMELINIAALQLKPLPLKICTLAANVKCAKLQVANFANIADGVSYVNKSDIETIFCHKDNIRLANDLLWGCPSVKQVICIDADNIMQDAIEKSELMYKKLWNYLAVNAKDDRQGGAWFSSYTGETFTLEEMDDFVRNVEIKLAPYLGSSKKVLDIGCSSGITMFALAGKVGKYVGLDMSNVMIDKNRAKVEVGDISNIELHCLYAHELDILSEDSFDIAIMNSVVQCFDGHMYFKRVLKMLIEKMSDNGIVFIGDVLDAGKRLEFYHSLDEYRAAHTCIDSVSNADLTRDLFLAEEFFYDLRFDFNEIKDVQISGKHFTIENELTRYRYDVVIVLDKKHTNVLDAPRLKRCFACIV